MKPFDPTLLQALVAFADAGTLARAADIVGRTPSAVTAQMQRLEAAAGVPLLRDDGRRKVLTDAGSRLVAHARRILAANREALMSVAGAAVDGRVGLGITQDFARGPLTEVLSRFARTHPRVRLDLRVGGTADLSEAYRSGQVDLLVVLRNAVEPDEVAVFAEPMCWLAAPGGLAAADQKDLPLALIDPPCAFRAAALSALDAANRSYRIAATSPSLAGCLAAVAAGVAVTARTPRWAAGDLAPAPASLDLPALPKAEYSIRMRPDAGDAARRLGAALAEDLPDRRT
ncbi:LysR substrate-binding domain-containing protein [Rhodobium gokarnense]|uniref:DNA-binding transcriptional LysR family regulator n=1 Tax=Rhodobium gokarnense TaxID=364296 RepID=A0ABT3H5T7_9HYPH|nr:LysR substrate-binding domain-containing protein [Rhodobium gokarnense]MCW2305757.1 DNA-binding transcriptional LysR family regulator [Rhodobium gokarnense]